MVAGGFQPGLGLLASYDVTPDGQRFLMVQPDAGTNSAAPVLIVVVENWFTELERLVPTEPTKAG